MCIGKAGWPRTVQFIYDNYYGFINNYSSALSWRDIQYLIVYTSNPYKLVGGNWTQTGAGLRVSPQFGFGAIDAEAIITRAKYWTTVPERLTCFIRPSSTLG